VFSKITVIVRIAPWRWLMKFRFSIARLLCAFWLAGLIAGCAVPGAPPRPEAGASSPGQLHVLQVLNRVTWGVNSSSVQAASAPGLERYLEQQLHPGAEPLPAPVQAQIDAMSISHGTLETLVLELEQRRKDADSFAKDDDRKAAQQVYQQELNRLARARKIPRPAGGYGAPPGDVALSGQRAKRC
jgi:hypothetical protein